MTLPCSILNDNDEIYNVEDCEFASKKRKMDHFRNSAKSQCKIELLFTSGNMSNLIVQKL